MSDNKEVLPSEEKAAYVCPRCRDQGVISVLGAGGDYENWACPECRPKDYTQDVRQHYGHGGYDSDNAD